MSTVNDKSQNNLDATFKLDATAIYTFRGNANDSSINGNNGTWTGTETYTTDHLGDANSAASFDGSSNISLGDNFDIELGDFTARVWFKTTDTTVNKNILTKRNDSTGTESGWGFRLQANGDLRTYFGDGTTGKDTTFSETRNISNDGNWHCVHFVVDRTNGELRQYFDSVSITPQDISTITGNQDNGFNCYIGASRNGTILRFIGDMSNVVIIKGKAFSDLEVLNDYTLGQTRKLDQPLTANGYDFYNISEDFNQYVELSSSSILSNVTNYTISFDTTVDEQSGMLMGDLYGYTNTTNGISSGAFYANPPLQALGDIQLFLDMNENPSAGVVTDLSSQGNNGDFKINATAYYPFNGNANDESVNSNNGTVFGATLTTDYLGNANNAYTFNGSSDYITINAGTFSTDWTFSFRANITDDGNRVSLIGDSNSTYGYLMFQPAVNQLSFEPSSINGKGGGITIPSLTSYFGSDREYTITALSGVLSIYIDGTFIGSTNAIDGITDIDCVFLGRGYTGIANSYFSGTMSSALLLNGVALSATEVANLYNVTSAHKLDKPLVTKTDGDGNSITGYEFWGAPVTGGVNTGVNIENTTPLGNTSASIYIEFYKESSSFATTSDVVFYRAFGSNASARNGTLYLYNGSTRQFSFFIRDNAGNSVYVRDVDSWNFDTKYRILCVVDKDTGTGYLFVNNVLKSSATISSYSGTLDTNTSSFDINRRSDSGLRIMSQLLSKPIIIPRVLTETERNILFNSSAKNFDANHFAFTLTQTDGTDKWVYNPTAHSLDTEYNVQAQVDHDTNEIRLYVDNVLVDTESFDGTIQTGANQPRIGSTEYDINYPSKFELSSPMIFTRILDSTERGLLFSSTFIDFTDKTTWVGIKGSNLKYELLTDASQSTTLEQIDIQYNLETV